MSMQPAVNASMPSNPGGPHPLPSEVADLGANTAIARRLRAYYDDVASEPVPDRFLSLLDALDRAEIKRASRE